MAAMRNNFVNTELFSLTECHPFSANEKVVVQVSVITALCLVNLTLLLQLIR